MQGLGLRSSSDRASTVAVSRIPLAPPLVSRLAAFAGGPALLTAAMAVFAVACAGTRLTRLAPEQPYPPVPAESVWVFPTLDLVPGPYEALVALDMPHGTGGGFVEAAQREVGAVGANAFIFVAAAGPDVGAAVASGAMDAATALALGTPISTFFQWLFARPRVRLVGVRSLAERRREARPVAVSGGHELQSISAGSMHTCGLTQDGAAYCWGWNSVGQLGDGSTTPHSEPTKISGYLEFASLSSGLAHTCGLVTDGTAYCWGANNSGQLGRGYETEYSETATPTTDALVFSALTAGLGHTCGLTVDGDAYCWGHNAKGQLGTGDTTTVTRPTPVTGQLQFASLTVGFAHTCGVTTTGAAYCWGWNEEGQVGDGSTSDRSTPVAVSGELSFASLAAGRLHTCGLTPTGAAYCWGFGVTGALGDGSKKSRRKSPVAVSSDLSFESLSAGAYFTCALTASGQAYCWGLNQHRQLGTNSTTDECKFWRDIKFSCSTVPLAVSSESSFMRISAGVAHACGVAIDGRAHCWGAATAGQLGDTVSGESIVP